MNAITTLPNAADPSLVRFVPYGSADEIKLSIKIVQDIIAVPTKSGATCSRRDALKFIAMCQARKLNPFEGDAFLIGYDGKNGPEFSLITAHQAFLKRAEIHPEFDGMKSGIIVLKNEETGEIADIEGDFHLRTQTVVGGWATVYFKNRTHPITRRIRLERFNKGFAQWAVDPAGMVVKCAEADALRSSFPTMLGGLYMKDEISLDVAPGKRTEGDGAALVQFVDEATTKPRKATPIMSGRGDDEDEAAEAAAGLAPERKTAPEDRPPTNTPQDQLAAIVTGAGHNFEELRDWAIAEGHLDKKHADLPGFDLMPDAICVRLIRAQKGMLDQLAKRKVGV